jgi:hypothetical protein
LVIWPFLHSQIYFLFIKNKNKKYEQYENFGMILVELKKNGTLWGWIAKIKTLVFELKNNVNFGMVNCNFPLLLLLFYIFAQEWGMRLELVTSVSLSIVQVD